MIGLEYNGQFLYIPRNTKIRMRLFSPLFYATQSGYSGPITLPIEQNSPILGYFDDMKYRGEVGKTFDVRVYLKDNYWKKAVMRIKNITDTDYVVNLNVDIGVVSELVSSKNMSNVDFGGNILTRAEATHYLKVQLLGASPGGNVTLGILNSGKDPGDFANVTVPFNGTNAQTMSDLADAFNALDKNFYGLGDVTAVGDTITIYSIDENTAIMYGISNPGTGRSFARWDSGEETRDYVNDVAANPEDYNFAFPTIKNQQFYSSASGYEDHCGYVNYYKDDEYKINGITGTGAGIFPLVPMPYLVWVLKRTLQDFGYVTTGKILEDADILKLLVYNNYSIDKKYGELKSYSPYINLQNHMPPLSVSEFLKSVQAAFFLCFIPNNERKTFDIKTKNEVLTDPRYEDWTAISSPKKNEEVSKETSGYKIEGIEDDEAIEEKSIDLTGKKIGNPVATIGDLPSSGNVVGQLRYVESQNAYYEAITDATWAEYSQKLGVYEVGQGSQEIDLKAAVTAMQRYNAVSDFDLKWLVPYILQSGGSEDMGKADFAFRPLFYHGLQNDGDGNPYPFASPYEYNYAETELGPYAIIPEKLYEKFGKKWLDFLSTSRSINLPITLDIDILANIDFFLKKRIEGVTYFLADIDFSIAQNGQTEAVGLYYRYG